LKLTAVRLLPRKRKYQCCRRCHRRGLRGETSIQAHLQRAERGDFWAHVAEWVFGVLLGLAVAAAVGYSTYLLARALAGGGS